MDNSLLEIKSEVELVLKYYIHELVPALVQFSYFIAGSNRLPVAPRNTAPRHVSLYYA